MQQLARPFLKLFSRSSLKTMLIWLSSSLCWSAKSGAYNVSVEGPISLLIWTEEKEHSFFPLYIWSLRFSLIVWIKTSDFCFHFYDFSIEKFKVYQVDLFLAYISIWHDSFPLSFISMNNLSFSYKCFHVVLSEIGISRLGYWNIMNYAPHRVGEWSSYRFGEELNHISSYIKGVGDWII